jgi:hypothetical protein
MAITRRLIMKLGIDRAIGFSLLARARTILSGPVTLYFIVSRFSNIQQGFYFTLNSLLALQIFFELGLLTVIAQFASHEFAHLAWERGGEISGDFLSKARFADLLSMSTKWFTASSIILFIVLVPSGLYFLSQAGRQVDFAWKLPWVLAVISVAGNLAIVPFYAVVLGSGEVATVNLLEVIGGVSGTLLAWVIIILHGGLYAVSAIGFANLLVGIIYFIIKKPKLLLLVFGGEQNKQTEITSRISWWAEIWPMQWRIAFSWAASFFIFQLFTPMLFHFKGPIVAGQMGMTLSLVNAMIGVSAAWMQAKSPKFGKYVALGQWNELDSLFSVTFKQSLFVIGASSIAVVLAVYFLQLRFAVGARFLPVPEVAVLMAAVCCNVAINGFTAYARAFKSEPMWKISVIWGIVTGLSTFVLAHFSSLLVCIGYLIVSVLYAMPATYFRWKRFRRMRSN